MSFADDIKSINNKDVIIVTHLLNKNDLFKSNDQYFSYISRNLNNSGHSTLVSKINHTKSYLSHESFYHNEFYNETIILPSLRPFKEEIKSIYIC